MFGSIRDLSIRTMHRGPLAAVEAELAWQRTGVPLAHLTDQLDIWCRDCRATSTLRELAERLRKSAEDDGDQPQ